MKPREILAAISTCQATCLVLFAAVAFTGWWWAGNDVERWTLDARAFHGEPWRLLTSSLPHVDIIHLIFNLYWVWVFGARIESVFGSIRTAGLFALLAAGSAEAEYAVFEGGVGLSGVGYGLFGMLWVLSDRDARFSGAIDRRTIEMFGAWFFLCIALSVAGVWQVANVAHGAGAVLGAIVGAAVAARSRLRRAAGWLGLVSALVLTTCGCTFGRRYVNFSEHVGDDLAYLGYEALIDDDYPRAVRLFESAVAANDRVPGWWKDLGIAYQQLKRFSDAADAFQRAHDLDPSDAETKQAADYCRARARTST
ncbi:MAG TPA: rhomboid family intramembrane serine protease [Pirellulales bacterium]|nr:rhomboid family intramembrane serine protease [Pirellulales bacterium]